MMREIPVLRLESWGGSMGRILRQLGFRVVPVAILIGASTIPMVGQSGAKKGEWPTYGADLGNTRYSPLDQITAENFSKLDIAWRFKTESLGPRPEYQFESTPLMVRGVVYSTAGTRRAVVALDAVTGELMWMHSEREGERGEAAPRQLSGRGLAYWTDGRDERILYVTPGYRLVALNAKTGALVPAFGANGAVDLKQDDDQVIDPMSGEIGLHATPMVARNVVIVGAAGKTGANPKSFQNVKGYVRGFDVRTGKRLWIFHTIPQQGEFGVETWEKESWVYTGNTGVWGQISIDEELGLAYLPVEMPTGDYYGGHRPGNGLFGESLVAVDLQTGKRKWHYQLVHHGIWDMDIPCAVSRSGRSKNDLFPRVMCPASGIRRRNRSRRSRRPTSAPASPRTTSSTSRPICTPKPSSWRRSTRWDRCSRRRWSARWKGRSRS